MYVDPAVVRHAVEAPGEASKAIEALLGAPRDAASPPAVAAIGAPGLIELVEWEKGEAGGTRVPPDLAIARAAARTLRVLPLTAYEVFLAADLVRTYPDLPSRAALHVAIMLNNGELELVSDDTTFDRVSEIRRIPPARVPALLGRRARIGAAAGGSSGRGAAGFGSGDSGPGDADASRAPGTARGEGGPAGGGRRP